MHWIQDVSTSYGLCCIVQLDCSLGSEHMAGTVCSVLALTPCSQCILPGFKHFSPDSRLDAVSGSAFRLFTNSVLLKKHNGLVMKKWRLFIFVCHHSQCGNNKLVYLWIKIHLNIFLSLCFTSKGLICVLISTYTWGHIKFLGRTAIASGKGLGGPDCCSLQLVKMKSSVNCCYTALTEAELSGAMMNIEVHKVSVTRSGQLLPA